jgi:EREBP-like factor
MCGGVVVGGYVSPRQRVTACHLCPGKKPSSAEAVGRKGTHEEDDFDFEADFVKFAESEESEVESEDEAAKLFAAPRSVIARGTACLNSASIYPCRLARRAKHS